MVEAPRELDDGLGEQPSQEFDLFFLPCAAGAEVLSEGFVFDVIPSHTDTEAQPPSGEQIDVGGLPCHQGSLALWKDEDPGEPMRSVMPAR